MSALWRHLRLMGRALVGMPDHAAYLRHMAEHHPGCPVLDEQAFFLDRQAARYGGKGGGKCC